MTDKNLPDELAVAEAKAKAWRRLFWQLLPYVIELVICLFVLFVIATMGLIWLSTQVHW